MAYNWVRASDGNVPKDSVVGGIDKDDTKIYIGRANHQGDLIPAKIVPSQRAAYVSYNGNEITIKNYEVLCNSKTPIAWVTASNGCVPLGAMPVGRTSGGECLYMGRVFHDGTLTPGKVHPSHKVCYIPYDGKEIPYKEYEVLLTHNV